MLAKTKLSQDLLDSAQTTNQQRIEALRFLLDNKYTARFLSGSKGDEFVKLRDRTLEGAQFTGVRSTGVQFAGTAFKQVGFTKASLPLAGFSQTTLTDVRSAKAI